MDPDCEEKYNVIFQQPSFEHQVKEKEENLQK